MEEEIESVPAISYQNNYKTKDCGIDVNVNKAKANDNKLTWAKLQYPIFDLLVLEAFFLNLIDLLVKNTPLFESKEVNCNYKKFFIATTSKKSLNIAF